MKPKSKEKQARKYRGSDSSSDSDDAPLVEFRRSSTKNDLLSYSIEKCEFCDKIFNNKYNMLVHNAKHIIIPLLNQKLHKCSQCHRHFNSIESLEWHSISSHAYISDNKDYLPKILQSFVKKEPVMVLKKEPLFTNNSNTVNGKTNAMTSDEENVSEILKSLVKKEPVTMITKLADPVIDNNKKLLESFINRQPITLLKNEKFDFDNDSGNDCITILDSDDEYTHSETNCKTEFEYDGVESENENSNNPKLRDRIKFEDENEESSEVQDVLNVNAVNLNNRRKNAIILGNKPNVTENTDTDWRSVHNDELTKPGMFKCKKCSKNFPNRFEEIIHETSHLTIKRRLPFLCRYCDWYVATSPQALVRHRKIKHPDFIDQQPTKQFKKCEECGLSYINKTRHRQNYHREYLCDCGKVFQSRTERSEHKFEHTVHDESEWLISTTKVCEFCYQWFKEKSNLKYQRIKNYSKFGERLPCERCEKMFFELQVVRIRWRKWKKDPLKEVEKDFFDMKKSKKPKTNSDRLKNVQQRLKKLKELNKF